MACFGFKTLVSTLVQDVSIVYLMIRGSIA